MLVYIVMFSISLLLAILAFKTESKIKRIIFVICAAIPFIVVSGIRFDVGTDYFYRYVPDFNTIKEGGNIESLEILFKLIINFSLMISDDYYLLFIITSTIIVSLIFGSIYKDSRNIIMSVAIFFCRKFFL